MNGVNYNLIECSDFLINEIADRIIEGFISFETIEEDICEIPEIYLFTILRRNVRKTKEEIKDGILK
jgi:hypothetical protein